jgi:hypothetical protein
LANTENIKTNDNCNCGGTEAIDIRQAVEAIVASVGKGEAIKSFLFFRRCSGPP